MVDPTGWNVIRNTPDFFNHVLDSVVVTARKVDNFRWLTATYHAPILGFAAERGNNLADSRPLAAGNFDTSLAVTY